MRGVSVITSLKNAEVKRDKNPAGMIGKIDISVIFVDRVGEVTIYELWNVSRQCWIEFHRYEELVRCGQVEHLWYTW